ncbi:unnamed protein product [Lactuca virosa]|uniref:Uncharacterized protein n=1 Tax=Lactuca virosa TaxID=75947 RepID=A0AAU9MHZ6_9ASTR|nr:unnamed protein product [Lactuca virosa]
MASLMKENSGGGPTGEMAEVRPATSVWRSMWSCTCIATVLLEQPFLPKFKLGFQNLVICCRDILLSFSSSSSNSDDKHQHETPPSQSQSSSSMSFYIDDVLASLKGTTPFRKPSLFDSNTCAADSPTRKVDFLEEIDKNLSAYRRSSAQPLPSSLLAISFQQLYKRNVLPQADPWSSSTEDASKT